MAYLDFFGHEYLNLRQTKAACHEIIHLACTNFFTNPLGKN